MLTQINANRDLESDALVGDDRTMSLDEYSQKIKIENGSRCIAATIYSATDTPETKKAGLIAYAFYDAHDKLLQPVEPCSSSAKVGPYFYLDTETEDGIAVTRKRLPIPTGAVWCELQGRGWKSGVETYLYKEPLIRQPGSNLQSEFEEISGEIVPMDVADFVSAFRVDKRTAAISISATFRSKKQEMPSKALLLVDFLDDEGEMLLPTGELPVNPELGSFIYLESREHEAALTKVVSIQVPNECVQVRLRGRAWTGSAIELLEPISICADKNENDAEHALTEFLESIPLDENLIVIYTTARAIGSGSLLLRSNRLALEYAEAGNWVVFFPFGSLADDESPRPRERIYQADRRYFRSFMDSAMRRQGAHNKFICSSFSDLNVAASIDRMRDNYWTAIYEVRDDMEEFNRVGYSKWFNPLLEARVAKRADKVVAVSPRLQEKIATISGRSDVQLIPNAAPDELVASTSYLRRPEAIELRRNSRRVGYIGHLTPSWFDWDLLIQVARRLPSVDFEIIGHGFPKDLTLPLNVIYLGAMTHAECIPYVEHWRAGLIPFKISPLTYGVDPNKIYEYVAMGLRTVSAPMGSVQDIPGTWVYEDVDGAVAGISDAVCRDITQVELAIYDDYICRTKWSDRARQMLVFLEGEEK